MSNTGNRMVKPFVVHWDTIENTLAIYFCTFVHLGFYNISLDLPRYANIRLYICAFLRLYIYFFSIYLYMFFYDISV